MARHGATPALPPDPRSAMARASDAAPFRPYVYRGETAEPPPVIAARERHRARDAELERVRAAAEAEIDRRLAALAAEEIGPGPEWYRERALEDGDEMAEIVAARDRYHAAQDALSAPPAPPPRYAAPPLPPVRVPDGRGRAQGEVR